MINLSNNFFLLRNLLKNYEQVLEVFNDYLKNEKSFLLTYFNQHCFNIFWNDNNYAKNISENFLVYQEGVGMFLFLRFLGLKNIQRLDATEINKVLLDKIIENKNRFFIIGDNFEKTFVSTLMNKYENFVGYKNGYFPNDGIFKLQEEIKNSGAEFVLIGMGVPKQEFLAAKLRQSLPDISFICVGNFLRYYFGLQKRAPKWMRQLQLEWLYRLIQEPNRMIKRYVLGIPLFVFRVVKIKLLSHSKV